MIHPFVQQFNAIMLDETIRAVDKMVVAVLWFRKGCNDECWPSIPRLVKDVGADRKTIMAATKRLVDLGRVKVHRENGKENHYELITSAGNGTSPKTGTTILGTGPKNDTCQKRDLPSAGNGTLKEVQEKKEKNSSPTPPREGKATRPKLPLVKKKEELAKILDNYDIEPLRKEYEPQGLDVDKWWKSTQDYVLNGSAEKPYPNPAKWRDFARAFRKSCQGALERGLFQLRQTQSIDDGPSLEAREKRRLEQEAALAKINADREAAEAAYEKLNLLPSEAVSSLRTQALVILKARVPNVRPPETVVRLEMIKIYEAEKARAP